MPTFRFTARWNGISALPEDVYENVLYYDLTAAEGTYLTVADGIVAAFDTWSRHGGVNGAEVRVYSLAGGQPVYRKDYPAYVKSSGTAPGEVAICLSYATAVDWEASTARRRGRIFLGPLNASVVGGARPLNDLQTATLDLGTALAAVGGAAAQWMLYSPADSTSAPIQSISVDDAWDTQRRRGLAPTNRQVRAL